MISSLNTNTLCKSHDKISHPPHKIDSEEIWISLDALLDFPRLHLIHIPSCPDKTTV